MTTRRGLAAEVRPGTPSATIARIAVTGALAIAIAAWTATGYTTLVVPLHRAFGTVCGQLSGWRLDDVRVTRGSTADGERLTAIASVDDPRTGLIGAIARTHVTVGGVVQTPAVLLAIVCAWPIRRPGREHAWRSALALLALPVVELLATGLALQEGAASAVAVLWSGDPDASSAWSAWARLMASGGRLLLAALAGLAVVAGAAQLSSGRGA